MNPARSIAWLVCNVESILSLRYGGVVAEREAYVISIGQLLALAVCISVRAKPTTWLPISEVSSSVLLPNVEPLLPSAKKWGSQAHITAIAARPELTRTQQHKLASRWSTGV